MQINTLIRDIRLHGGIVTLSFSEASPCPQTYTLATSPQDQMAISGLLKLIATRLGVSSDAGSRELSYISNLKD